VVAEGALLHPPRFYRVAADELLDELAHANVDQLEQIRRGGVETVVEVENPGVDVPEWSR
jgi:hypothetical protein